jgi:hypothetical protein
LVKVEPLKNIDHANKILALGPLEMFVDKYRQREFSNNRLLLMLSFL